MDMGCFRSCSIGPFILFLHHEKEEMKLTSKRFDLFFYFYFLKKVEDSL